MEFIDCSDGDDDCFSLPIGTLAAIGVSKMSANFRLFFETFFITPMVIPVIIFAVGLFFFSRP